MPAATRRPPPALRAAALVWLLVAGCGWTTADLPPATERCDLGRGNEQGVAGHDLAASTRLPDGRVLFVFGDTYLGSISGDERRVRGLLNSTGAVLPASADVCDPRLRYLTDADGVVRPLLPRPPVEGTAYWPVDVAVVGDRVWMLYRWVEAIGDGPLELRIHGTGLAVARTDELVFRRTRRLLVPGAEPVPSALAADGDRLLTVLCESDRGPCRIATVDTTDADLRTAEGPVIEDGATEMSLGRVGDDAGRWRVATMSGLSCRLRLLSPPPPGDGGPWPSRTILAPEPARGSLCYAGRVQEAFSDSDRVVATWVDSAAVQADADRYWPHVVEIDLSG